MKYLINDVLTFWGETGSQHPHMKHLSSAADPEKVLPQAVPRYVLLLISWLMDGEQTNVDGAGETTSMESEMGINRCSFELLTSGS